MGPTPQSVHVLFALKLEVIWFLLLLKLVMHLLSWSKFTRSGHPTALSGSGWEPYLRKRARGYPTGRRGGYRRSRWRLRPRLYRRPVRTLLVNKDLRWQCKPFPCPWNEAVAWRCKPSPLHWGEVRWQCRPLHLWKEGVPLRCKPLLLWYGDLRWRCRRPRRRPRLRLRYRHLLVTESRSERGSEKLASQ